MGFYQLIKQIPIHFKRKVVYKLLKAPFFNNTIFKIKAQKTIETLLLFLENNVVEEGEYQANKGSLLTI